MTDYKKLIDLLRTTARNVETDFAPSLHQTRQRAEVINRAAGAIEELLPCRKALDLVREMGGRWLVGLDRNLYSMNVPTDWPPEGTKSIRVYPIENEEEKT